MAQSTSSTIMRTWIGFLLCALCASEVIGSYSYYHGPINVPHVLHSGYLADTHEVAAAKSAHLAALATQSHGYGYGGSYGYSHDEGYSGSYGGDYGHGDFRYHGPIAIPHVLHDGHIADTHEVAAAKAEHFAAVAKAKAHSGYGHDYSGRYAGGYGEYSGAYSGAHYVAPYHGPLAKPVVLKSGYLADTHEVAAAKHHHLEALHKANHYAHYNY
ncbi:cuticle protein 5-like [Homalodisca vitripennis]|uniref:cuticle protein 5-like n=1 Tax=Homalodisca vitripennis TaxID=197043 RepID=UPI001EEA155D|nr:cuticle protein 5-like [Homalodisca vitripennis]